MSVAERSAAYRARRKAEAEAKAPPVRIRYRRPADRRSRPERWRDAVAALIDIQADYQMWLDGLPEALKESPTADLLREVCELDLAQLEIELPRGFGRD